MSIKEYMSTYGFTVSQLVEVTGFSRQYIYRWLSEPDLMLRTEVTTFHVVAEALNLDMDTLYRMVLKSWCKTLQNET